MSFSTPDSKMIRSIYANVMVQMLYIPQPGQLEEGVEIEITWNEMYPGCKLVPRHQGLQVPRNLERSRISEGAASIGHHSTLQD